MWRLWREPQFVFKTVENIGNCIQFHNSEIETSPRYTGSVNHFMTGLLLSD